MARARWLFKAEGPQGPEVENNYLGPAPQAGGPNKLKLRAREGPDIY